MSQHDQELFTARHLHAACQEYAALSHGAGNPFHNFNNIRTHLGLAKADYAALGENGESDEVMRERVQEHFDRESLAFVAKLPMYQRELNRGRWKVTPIGESTRSAAR